MSVTTFSSLGLKPEIVKSIQELGFVNPTPVQEKVIPFVLKNTSDIVVQAQTGTGKTAAFGLPIIQQINPQSQKIQVLILTPTRELGQQVNKQLFKFTKYLESKIYTEAVFGGEHISVQLNRLRRTTHILVATPGRLVDLMEREVVSLSSIKTVVLDEADEMLKMGFKKDLEKILSQVVAKKQTWLFSATMPKDIQDIIHTYLNSKAEHFSLSKNAQINTNIEHQFLVVRELEKLDVLLEFLKTQKKSRGVIFCSTKDKAISLTQQLKNKNHNVDVLQGDMHQKDRDKVLRASKNKTLQILISTDVAARGIDIEGLNYVVHYDIPAQLDYYTHRSGRTARGGKKGLALSFVTTKEIATIRTLEREYGIRMVQIR
jgi:ATP-dependent RNA helicase DeaD